MDNHICVYTCITGDYDLLHEIDNPEDGIDYYCFTNNHTIKSKTWKVIYITNDNLSDHQLSRQIKMLGHPILKKYDISLWMDASVIWDEKISLFIQNYLGEASFAAFKHSMRNNVMDEARECIRIRKDNPDNIKKAVNFLSSESFPDNVGLHEMTVFIKRHNDCSVQKAMKLWSTLNKQYSKRDQLTFDYVIWKTKLSISTIELNVWNNEYFHTTHHNNKKSFSYALAYFDNNKSSEDIEEYESFNYDTDHNSLVAEIIVPFSCHTIQVNLYDVPYIKCQNLTFESSSIKRINYPDYIQLESGILLASSYSYFQLQGNFHKNERIKISFIPHELTRDEVFEALLMLNAKLVENNSYKTELENIKNSTSWKLIRKIRGLFPPY